MLCLLAYPPRRSIAPLLTARARRRYTYEHTSRESGVYGDHPRRPLENDTSYE